MLEMQEYLKIFIGIFAILIFKLNKKEIKLAYIIRCKL